jgi:hypothetical protein
VVFQVDLYDRNTLWYCVFVLRRVFTTDESNVIFAKCGNALQDLAAKSGSLIKSELGDLFESKQSRALYSRRTRQFS